MHVFGRGDGVGEVQHTVARSLIAVVKKTKLCCFVVVYSLWDMGLDVIEVRHRVDFRRALAKTTVLFCF